MQEVLSLVLETSAHLCSWIPMNGAQAGVPRESQNAQDTTVPFQTAFVRLVCQYALVEASGPVVCPS